MPDSEVTLDYVLDRLVIWGSPSRVADKILAFREQVGDFGTCSTPARTGWTASIGRRSMILLAEQVLPRVNAAIGPSAQRPAAE